MTVIVRATVHGAISIVNAIATGKGSALGISPKVTAEIELKPGNGNIKYNSKPSDLFIKNIVKHSLDTKLLKQNDISISLSSEIPIGFGLKSSSAVSSVISLACFSIMNDEIDDMKVLKASIMASRESNVTITGALDDAAACYFGGFVLTNNLEDQLIRRMPAPNDLSVLVLLPHNVTRKNVNNLILMKDLFSEAFNFALKHEYWKAMNLNGLLTFAILFQNTKLNRLICSALENKALAISISGNGPSIAVVGESKDIMKIRDEFDLYGKILIAKTNNNKASVEKIIG